MQCIYICVTMKQTSMELRSLHGQHNLQTNSKHLQNIQLKYTRNKRFGKNCCKLFS